MRLACLMALAAAPAAAQTLDTTPRLAVMSAYEPEWQTLKGALEDAETHEVGPITFLTGTLEDEPVVLFLSGVSMVNAAMTTQMALENFEVTGLVFSGIAGGVDPDLDLGDVVIAERWGQYMDVVFARETEDGFALAPWMSDGYLSYGMMFTQPVEVVSPETGEVEDRFWFQTDGAMLDRARAAVEGLELTECASDGTCLSEAPQIVVGGSGVSGTVFVDNADFRRHVFDAFEARVLDMESAAVAHVAHVNDVPFLAIRSLSDLAGGGEGENEIGTFLSLAAENSAAVVRAFLAEGE